MLGMKQPTSLGESVNEENIYARMQAKQDRQYLVKERFMRRAQDRLYAAAACLQSEPHVFDQTEYESLYTELALSICGRCTVQEDCLLVVNPTENLYDGVAGGMVFKNGEVVERHTNPKSPKLRKLSK